MTRHVASGLSLLVNSQHMACRSVYAWVCAWSLPHLGEGLARERWRDKCVGAACCPSAGSKESILVRVYQYRGICCELGSNSPPSQ